MGDTYLFPRKLQGAQKPLGSELLKLMGSRCAPNPSYSSMSAADAASVVREQFIELLAELWAAAIHGGYVAIFAD
jgi:hypothetical protein